MCGVGGGWGVQEEPWVHDELLPSVLPHVHASLQDHLHSLERPWHYECGKYRFDLFLRLKSVLQVSCMLLVIQQILR